MVEPLNGLMRLILSKYWICWMLTICLLWHCQMQLICQRQHSYLNMRSDVSQKFFIFGVILWYLIHLDKLSFLPSKPSPSSLSNNGRARMSQNLQKKKQKIKKNKKNKKPQKHKNTKNTHTQKKNKNKKKQKNKPTKSNCFFTRSVHITRKEDVQKAPLQVLIFPPHLVIHRFTLLVTKVENNYKGPYFWNQEPKIQACMTEKIYE